MLKLPSILKSCLRRSAFSILATPDQGSLRTWSHRDAAALGLADQRTPPALPQLGPANGHHHACSEEVPIAQYLIWKTPII